MACIVLKTNRKVPADRSRYKNEFQEAAGTFLFGFGDNYSLQ